MPTDQNKQPTDNETATNANTNKTPTDNGDHRTSQEAFIYLCETQHIRILDEPVQRHNSGYQFYCLLCECHLRYARHVRDHIIIGEHLANKRRLNDRSRLKELLEGLRKENADYANIQNRALDFLCVENTQNEYSGDLRQQQQDIQQIRCAVQQAMGDAFGPPHSSTESMVETFITGSFLTGLHTAKLDTCDLNLFIKFTSNDPFLLIKLHALHLRTQEALKNVLHHLSGTSGKTNPLPVRLTTCHFCPAIIQFTVAMGRFAYAVSVSIGDQAEDAYLSTRLVFVYLTIWPPIVPLLRFVRRWADINQLNAQNGISNFAFDNLCIFYLQQTRYLPVLHELFNEILSRKDLNFPFTSVHQLCSAQSDQALADACSQLRSIYYGDKVPVLSAGQMVYGFFKYFGTEFDIHWMCKLDSLEPVEKPLGGKKHFILIDPFLDSNIVKLRMQGSAHLWNSFIKTAAYLCLPKGLFSVNFTKIEFEWRKIRVIYLKIDEHTWTKAAHCGIGEKTESSKDFDYSLEDLVDSDEPPVTCQLCNRHGHNDSDCTLLRPSPSTEMLAPIRPWLNKELSKAITKYYKENKLAKSRKVEIMRFIEELRDLLAKSLGDAEIKLTSFGSVVNGFGTADCDLDLCLKSTKLSAEGHIRKLSENLRNFEFKTECVINAKVPIVKFEHASSGYKGDISFGNCLALRNSEMLNTYASLDKRVPRLGLYLKHWAKQNRLNSSPHGSFSSYSLIVMLIHYLQRGCQPPVLPFLQELAAEEPREKLEGWDVTFARISPAEWEKRNKQTLAELFRGFMRYYSGVFDASFDVVQIRSSSPLHKMDKRDGTRRWNQFTFCVEDPFDLSHNLTAGIKTEVYLLFLTRIRAGLSQMALADQRTVKCSQMGMEPPSMESLSSTSISSRNGQPGKENEGLMIFFF